MYSVCWIMMRISYFPISVKVEASKMHFRDLLKIAGHKNKAMTMHEKPYLLFPNVLKRWSFQKNRTGIWSFLYYQYFFFPIICSYSLDTKGKMIFLKKYLEMWCFLQMFWKDGLSKKLTPEHNLFCNIWKDGIYFFLKIWYFFFRWKMKDDL